MQKVHYEKVFPNYNPLDPRVAKVREFFSHLPTRQTVLDVGCSTGQILAPFAERHDIYGLDVSESVVQAANQNGLKAMRHDLESSPLPFATESFDVVFCGEVIEHMADTDWFMSELNRVLRAGGKLILTFPNIRTALSLVMMMFFNLPPRYAARYRAPHFRDFTLRTIKIVLRNHKFLLEKVVGSCFFLPQIGEFGFRLATFFPSWAEAGIIVAAKIGRSVYQPDETVACSLY